MLCQEKPLTKLMIQQNAQIIDIDTCKITKMHFTRKKFRKYLDNCAKMMYTNCAIDEDMQISREYSFMHQKTIWSNLNEYI